MISARLSRDHNTVPSARKVISTVSDAPGASAPVYVYSALDHESVQSASSRSNPDGI